MRKAIVLPVGIVVTLGAAYVGGLAYVKHRAISEAADHGVALTIDRVRVTPSGIYFEDIGATSVRFANTNVHVDEITSDFSAENVVANGVEVKADGPITPSIAPADRPVTEGTAGPEIIHVHSAHMSWTNAFQGTDIEFTNANGDLPLVVGFRSPDVTWTTDVAVTAYGKKFGPFSAEFTYGMERNLVVYLDPSDHGDAFVRVTDVGGPAQGYEATISGRPLSKLGIPTSALGVQLASDPKISLHLYDHTTHAAGAAPHSNGSIEFGTDPIALPGLPEPAAISLSMNWSGDSTLPIPLNADPRVTGSSLRIGPFHGPLVGTITRPENGVAVDLAFASQPVPCSKFSSGDPLKNLLGSSAFGAMAALAGAQSNVTGDVKLSGSVQFDSRDPAARSISFTPASTCGLSISLGTAGK